MSAHQRLEIDTRPYAGHRDIEGDVRVLGLRVKDRVAYEHAYRETRKRRRGRAETVEARAARRDRTVEERVAFLWRMHAIEGSVADRLWALCARVQDRRANRFTFSDKGEE